MEEHKLALSILAVVAVIAAVSMAVLYQGVTGLMGGPVYEQPANHLPIYLQTSKVLENFNLCNQYICSYPVDHYTSENVPAEQVGVDELTGNLRCGCPDGKEFQIRPDYIGPGVY
jgi:hypothetical protein